MGKLAVHRHAGLKYDLQQERAMTQERKARAATYLLTVFLLYSPYLPAVLLQGIWDTLLFLFLGVFMLLVMAFREEFSAALAVCLHAVALQWNAATFAPAWRTLSFARVRAPQFPSLSPLFQRPPPLFV